MLSAYVLDFKVFRMPNLTKNIQRVLGVGPCRMVSYNIGHLAYLNAKRYGLERVFFGGFFIRGHPYTMETISFAIRFWSKVSFWSPGTF